MQNITLANSSLKISPICLGTMTFGEQVSEKNTFQILDRALERGVNFWDTAEMYSVPPRSETFGMSEKIIGNWFRSTARRDEVVLATKVAGPSRGMPWIRTNPGLGAADIITACDNSLRRLQTDYIDLYQIHWPERHVPAFGTMYFNPANDNPSSSIYEQLTALDSLVRAGKVREIGLSNETPYGVHEFINLAEKHGLKRVVSVQNPYALVNRSYENALDETCYRLNVGLLAYSPLGFGLLTGKYDVNGFEEHSEQGRMNLFPVMRSQRWGREDTFRAAKLYNKLAAKYSLTPTQMALVFCYHRWCVASTIIGVTSIEQLDENIDAYSCQLTKEILQEIDQIRWDIRDPAL